MTIKLTPAGADLMAMNLRDLSDPNTFQRGFDTDDEFRARIKSGLSNHGKPAMVVIAAAMPSRITDWTATEAAGYRAEIRTPGQTLTDDEKAHIRAEIRSRAVVPGVTLVFIEDDAA